MSWINNNRRRFLGLTAQRLVAFWFPTSSGNPLEEGQALAERMGYVCVYAAEPAWFVAAVAEDDQLRHCVQLCGCPCIILWATLPPGSYFVVVFLFGIAGKSMTESVRAKSPTGA